MNMDLKSTGVIESVVVVYATKPNSIEHRIGQLGADAATTKEKKFYINTFRSCERSMPMVTSLAWQL